MSATDEVRVFFVATNDIDALNSVEPRICVGANVLTRERSLRIARDFASWVRSAETEREAKSFAWAARALWDLWHDAYEERPYWLKDMR